MTDRELAGCALSEVLALLEKATPGEWRGGIRHDGEFIESPNGGALQKGDGFVIAASSNGSGYNYHDASAIAAAVNFLRKHGPELLSRTPSSEGDGRDGERWRYVRAHMDCLHLPGLDISGPSEERIDAAIDAAIAAAAGGS